MTDFLPYIGIGVAILFVLVIVIYLLSLRRVVETNVVHIVQRGGSTTSYGIGNESNSYYEFPTWVPVLGVSVRQLPSSNFDIDISKYSAYDKDRIPFTVDVKAFFSILDTNIAAQKVESFEELKQQLRNIVEGSIRSILAQSNLEEIMESRATFGIKFTESVQDDLKEWGVKPVRTIELMDIRDSENSSVIKQIMDKKMSAISMESRVEVAKNMKLAEQREIEAAKEISVSKAEAARISGEAQALSQKLIDIAKAEAEKESGIARELALREVAIANKSTEEERLKVIEFITNKNAEIQRSKALINAEEEKKTVEIAADAEAYRKEKEAEGFKKAANLDAEAKRVLGTAEAEVIALRGKAEADNLRLSGQAEAENKKEMELAVVIGQTTLAKEIGENTAYTEYLLGKERIQADKEVGLVKAQATGDALAQADLKLLVNSGSVESGMNSFADLLSSKGGSQINGLLESLSQTEEGRNLLEMFKSFTSKAGNGVSNLIENLGTHKSE